MAYQSPLEGKRVSVRANSDPPIESGTVTLADGTNITLNQSGSTITVNDATATGTSYLVATMTTDQTTNLSAGDHAKFNNVEQSSGSSISLDTSTTYTTTSGAASIGRFTLAANKTYVMKATLSFVQWTGDSSSGIVVYYWSTSAGSTMGVNGIAASVARSIDFIGCNAWAILTTSSSTLVEVRFTYVNLMSRIGANGFGTNGGNVQIHEIT